MEVASEIWNDYIRLNLYLVFFAGLAVVVYLTRDRWAAFGSVREPEWKNGMPNLQYHREAALVVLRAIWPIWAWMAIIGIPATIADVILGPK